MKIFLRALFCTALIFGLFPLPCAGADIPSVINKMQNAYAGMSSFRSEFTQFLLQRESNVTEKRTGVLLFQKPLRVRWETDSPHKELLLVTDKEIWNFLPDEELAYRYSRDLAEDSRSLIQVVTGQSSLDKDFDVEPAQSTDKENLIHLMLYPKEPTIELTEAQIWLDPGTFLIRRAMVMDFYGNTNTIDLQGLKPNASVTEKDFQFSPPKGIDIEDHTEARHPVSKSLLN